MQQDFLFLRHWQPLKKRLSSKTLHPHFSPFHFIKTTCRFHKLFIVRSNRKFYSRNKKSAMKKIISILLIVISSSAYAQNNAATATAKNTIALLGTYHFDNPNQDQFNINSDNVLDSKRQKEIEQLVALLAKYKPTHIALEFNAADSALDVKYQRYLKNDYSLAASEREQIGFRLAKLLGHPHICAVDAPDIKLDFNPGELANEYGPLLEQLNKTGNGVINDINQWLRTYSIGQVLAKMNSPVFDKLNVGLYYKYLLPIGKDSTQPGAEAVARWYKRNLLILHHIMKLTENKSGNRVLVIFGQGHTAMLKQFLQYSDEFTVEDIQKYLPAKK
jgi:hypothetical protein